MVSFLVTFQKQRGLAPRPVSAVSQEPNGKIAPSCCSCKVLEFADDLQISFLSLEAKLCVKRASKNFPCSLSRATPSTVFLIPFSRALHGCRHQDKRIMEQPPNRLQGLNHDSIRRNVANIALRDPLLQVNFLPAIAATSRYQTVLLIGRDHESGRPDVNLVLEKGEEMQTIYCVWATLSILFLAFSLSSL